MLKITVESTSVTIARYAGLTGSLSSKIETRLAILEIHFGVMVVHSPARTTSRSEGSSSGIEGTLLVSTINEHGVSTHLTEVKEP